MLSTRLRTPAWTILLTFTLLASACRDSSAPEPSAIVTMTSRVVGGPTYGTNAQGFPYIECDVEFEATATGTGAALWETGELFFYLRTDRSAAQDTLDIPAEQVAGFWDSPEIEVGGVQDFRVGFRAPNPFAVKLVMYYRSRPGSAIKSAEAEFACGPGELPSGSLRTLRR